LLELGLVEVVADVAEVADLAEVADVEVAPTGVSCEDPVG